MRTHPRLSCSLLAAALLGLGTASAVDLEGLVKNSPFGGTGVVAGPGVAPSTLEFRGMYAEGGVSYYSIYNTLTKQSSWVAEGEAPSTNVPVVVKGFDIANETLVIDNGGQPQQMALHQAVVIAYRGPSAAQLAAVSNAVAPQGPSPAVPVHPERAVRAISPRSRSKPSVSPCAISSAREDLPAATAATRASAAMTLRLRASPRNPPKMPRVRTSRARPRRSAKPFPFFP